MNKLVVLIDNTNAYNPVSNRHKGLMEYLKNMKYLSNPITEKVIDTLEVIDAYQIKVYSKYKKIEVIGNIENDNKIFDLFDKNTFYLVFSNKVKSKSVPENVAVVCSKLHISQNDNEGGIYFCPTDCYYDMTLSRTAAALDMVGITTLHVNKFKHLIGSNKYTNTGECVYDITLGFLLDNLGYCKKTETKKYLIKCINKLTEKDKVKFNGLGASIFTRLNEIIRDGKMSRENMLSYKGFKFVNFVIEKFEEAQKEVNKNKTSWNTRESYLERFIKSLLTVMLAHELKYYIAIGNNKILWLSDNVDIKFKDAELVLPHMETYVGYLITKRGSYYGSFKAAKLTMYREYTNKNILDYIHECKELRSMEEVNINFIYDNDKFVKRNLPS